MFIVADLVSLTGDYPGSSESTLVKMPHCWKSHATAHFYREGAVSIVTA